MTACAKTDKEALLLEMFFFIFGPSIQDFNPYSSLFIIHCRWSQKFTLANVGCSTPEEVQTLAKVGRDFTPLSKKEQKELVDRN